MNDFSLQGYRDILKELKHVGYSFQTFEAVDQHEASDPYVLLRHDVDFNLNDVLPVAAIEYEEGIRSTIFFQLRSPLYNPLGKSNYETIEALDDMGHELALHIDLSLYQDDYLEGLNKELTVLATFYPFASTRVISIHRPTHAGNLRGFHFPNVIHTYEQRFFGDIEYFSDSKGTWKNGHPISSIAFEERESFQLLIHPLWWVQGGSSSSEKIKNFVTNASSERREALREGFSLELGDSTPPDATRT